MQQVELFAAAFSDERSARRVVEQLKRMEKEGTIDVLDAAVMVKQADGKVKIDEIRELTPRKGLRRGALVGAVFGAIFPPALLASALVGGLAGGALGKFTDQGWKNDELKQLAEELPAGHSALVALVEDKWIEQFGKAIEGYERLSRLSFEADEAGVLIAAADGQSDDILVTKPAASASAAESTTEAASSDAI